MHLNSQMILTIILSALSHGEFYTGGDTFRASESIAYEIQQLKLPPKKKSPTRRKKPRCSDGKDNDKDGLKDYPKDPGCRSRKDNKEDNPPTAIPGPVLPPVSGDIEEGIGVSLKGKQIFPADNAWNKDISQEPVDPNSQTLIAAMGTSTGLHPDWGTFWEGRPIGFSYLVVGRATPKVSIDCYYASETDPGPYPMPLDAPIEGGSESQGDRHVITIDKDNWRLYELFDARPSATKWSCGSGAVFDLNSNATRPQGWTSADAAGLPIFPGLVRYDEVVERGEITHALRFTTPRTRRAYVAPATHFASSSTDPNLPPMGMRVRLRADFDISGYPPTLQVVLRALKKYGMFLADNGSAWYISGVHDSRWNDDELGRIRNVKGADFEVVKMGELVQ